MVSLGWPSILVVQALEAPLSPRVEPLLSHLGGSIGTQIHCTWASVPTVHLREARLGLAVPIQIETRLGLSQHTLPDGLSRPPHC